MENEDFYTNNIENNQLTDRDVQLSDLKGIIRYNRNWTVGTIYDQIQQGNIELNPKFQRRNAWDDERRSCLIESILIGIPIPEIILADHPDEVGKYIVIDGKQRLTTIAGYRNPTYNFWDKSKLTGLKVINDLNGKSYEEMIKDSTFEKQFINTDISVAILRNIPKYEVLYEIFYRLNTGSVPLNMQELRQVLYRGDFSDYLMEITDTNVVLPIHKVLGLSKPDDRLNDVEMLLRFFATYFLGNEYKSSLAIFLDNTMDRLNKEWGWYEDKVKEAYLSFNESIAKLVKGYQLIYEIENPNLSESVSHKVFEKEIGRLPDSKQFNKAIFEVQVYYFSFINEDLIDVEKFNKYLLNLEKQYKIDKEFSNSLRLATNDKKSYQKRFSTFKAIIEQSFEIHDLVLPFEENNIIA